MDRRDSGPTPPPGNRRDATHWQRRTRLLALEINAGWWFDRWLPSLFGIGVGGAFLLLWARIARPQSVPGVWLAIGVAAVVGGIVAWIDARRRFESLESARVLLEDRLGLDARLSAAAAGVGGWPGRRVDLDRRWPVSVRWERPLLRVAAIGAMLAAATLLPLADANVPRASAAERPADVDAVSRWADELRRERALDEASVEEISAAVEDLLARPREEWYGHATLEAAAHLRERTAEDLAELSRNLAEARRAAESMAAGGDAAEAAERGARLADVAARLATGNLRPEAGLGERSAEGLGELSPEELRALAAALARNREALAEALARAGDFDLSAFDELGAGEPCDECQACGECRECRDGKPCPHGKRCRACAARGGVRRGPGEAPLHAVGEQDPAGDRVERIVSPTDRERAAAGDLLEVRESADGPPDAADWTGPVRGGDAARPRNAGGPANVDELLPAEKAALRRYFQ